MDLFMPLGPNDFEVFPHSLQGVLLYLPEVQNLYIATPSPEKARGIISSIGLSDADNARVTVMDEKDILCPFDITTVREAIATRKPIAAERAGWYYQQLLKLYAPTVVPGIHERVLVMDADIVFVRECRFLQEGEPVYTIYPLEYANSYVHDCYYQHIKNLVPEIIPSITNRRMSFISHHMVIDRAILAELFGMVEGRTGEPFWKSFLDSIGEDYLERSGASEYEVYGYFKKHFHEKNNTRTILVRFMPLLDDMNEIRPIPYVFVGIHHYSRPRDWLSRLLDIQRGRFLL